MNKGNSDNKAISEISGKCSRCIAKCCRYYMVDLPTPRSRLDFDNLGWFLAHENTVLYVEDRKWYLCVRSKCRYLDENNRCTIYENRFQACQDHSDENCEFDSEYKPDLTFTTPEQLASYAEKRFSRMGRKKAKRKTTNLRSRQDD